MMKRLSSPTSPGYGGRETKGASLLSSTNLSASAPVFIPENGKTAYNGAVVTPRNTPPTPPSGSFDANQPWGLGCGGIDSAGENDALTIPETPPTNSDAWAAPVVPADETCACPDQLEADAKAFGVVGGASPQTPTDEDIINSLHSLGVSRELMDGGDVLDLARLHYMSSRDAARAKDDAVLASQSSDQTSVHWPHRASNTKPRPRHMGLQLGVQNSRHENRHLQGVFQQQQQQQQKRPAPLSVPTPPASPPHPAPAAATGPASVTVPQSHRFRNSYPAVMENPLPNSASALSSSYPTGARRLPASLEFRAQQEMILSLRRQLEIKNADLDRAYAQIREKDSQLKHAIRIALKHINLMNATIASQNMELRRRDDGKDPGPSNNTMADKFFIIFNNIASWAAGYYQFICPELQESAEALIASKFGRHSRYLDFIRNAEMKYLAITRIAVDYVLGNIVDPSTGILKRVMGHKCQFKSLEALADAMEKDSKLSETVCDLLEHHATDVAHEFIFQVKPLRSRLFDPAHEKNSPTSFLFICQEAARVCHLLLKQKIRYHTVFPREGDLFNTDFMRSANSDNVGLNVSEPIRDVALVEMRGARIVLCMLPCVWATPMGAKDDWKLWCKASVYISCSEA